MRRHFFRQPFPWKVRLLSVVLMIEYTEQGYTLGFPHSPPSPNKYSPQPAKLNAFVTLYAKYRHQLTSDYVKPSNCAWFWWAHLPYYQDFQAQAFYNNSLTAGKLITVARGVLRLEMFSLAAIKPPKPHPLRVPPPITVTYTTNC